LPEDTKNEKAEVSRRDFLVGAGAVVASGAVGAGILAGCGGGGETVTVTTTKVSTVPTTVTTTVGGGATVTKTVPTTVTTTVGGGGVEPWQEPEETHYWSLSFQ